MKLMKTFLGQTLPCKLPHTTNKFKTKSIFLFEEYFPQRKRALWRSNCKTFLELKSHNNQENKTSLSLQTTRRTAFHD